MKKTRLWLLAITLLAGGLAAPGAWGAVLQVNLTTLATFNTNGGGAKPFATPVMGPDGTLYGTTGFANTASGTNQLGVVYEITTNDANLILHQFIAADGAGLAGSLLLAGDGNLYGVATAGGANGMGTLFRLTTNGTFTVLYSFGSVQSGGVVLDGATPYGGLVQGKDGFIYGTTFAGGISNVGTIFQFSTNNNTLNPLHAFLGSDGAHPEETPLVEGSPGIFYGTTYQGGISNNGTVFKVTSEGTFTSLVQFNGTNGSGSYSGLSQGPDGFFYGTTVQGGSKGDGTVYRINTFGILTTLWNFSKTDGMSPDGGITVGPGNILYGTTFQGGAKKFGIVFQLTTNSQLTTLYSFTGKNDGSNPSSGVILDADGNLYGTTELGGTNNGKGTVYQLQVKSVPDLTITAPTANQRWSNSVFSVSGTASGNLNVTNVAYSVNSGAWSNATTANNWATWAGTINLMPGTNVFQSYAVDINGNVSVTNTVRLDYVVTTPLTVRTNGEGSITPVYNNVLLEIGKIYTMTAKPAKGEKFAHWANGNNIAITASPALTFTMASNLTYIADFADTNLPTLAITSLKTGAKFSNDTIIVTGTASDNIAVSNVQYEFNFGGFFPASTLNNWTNWSIPLTLHPGTNFLTVFALDTSDNQRGLQTVFIDYVPSAILTVHTNGNGTLKPNYNGAVLALSNNYTMTATPAKGYGFYFWNVGADMVSTPTLNFTMSTGLVITANFKDITPPTVSITTPKANAKFSNDVITVSGKATDNGGLTNVAVRINQGSWQKAAETGTVFSVTWSVDVSPVIHGTNVLEAYAMDIAGNLATNTVKFIGLVPPDWAPDSLVDSSIEVTPNSGDPVTVSFGVTNFSQADFLTSSNSGIGFYTYTNSATNAAELQIIGQVPVATFSNSVAQDILLNFTGLNSGTFTNVDSSDVGTFDIVPTATLTPASWNNHSITATNADHSHKTVLQFKSATSVTLTVNGSPNTDTYTAVTVGPVGAMLTVTDPGANGQVHYLQLTFTSKSAGHYEMNNYDSTGAFVDNDFGTFGFR
jgi:uncharacterized repeat protein (TIGR03803 family)